MPACGKVLQRGAEAFVSAGRIVDEPLGHDRAVAERVRVLLDFFADQVKAGPVRIVADEGREIRGADGKIAFRGVNPLQQLLRDRVLQVFRE